METTNVASSDIKFSNTTTNIGYAHAYFPGGWAGAGSVWLNPNYSSLNDPDVGEYGFQAVMHEVGHALGLNHAGNYNGGSPSYASNASHAQDSFMYTIMSYFGEGNTGADWRASDGRNYDAQTPMVHDILAIQAMYGADQTTRTGDTVYGFNSNTGSSIFDFTQNAHPVLTIWDAGGNDTLDLSGFSTGSVINLAAGSYSDADSMTNNIAIAYGATIENAVGGSGNDVINGNGVANKVYDRGGNDVVKLGGGNDYVLAGGGVDKYYGGSGSDYLSYYYSTSGVTLDLQANTASGGMAADDTISSFERASGSNTGGDKIYGTSGANTINTYGGNDKVYDRGGNDTVKLGNGNDYVLAGGGADTYHGGAGTDYLSYYYSTSGVRIDLQANTASGGMAADDTISGFESISGSFTGNDKIYGTTGSNTILGYGGDDKVYDRGGNDTVKLGDGNDYVLAGGGAANYSGGAGVDYLSYYYSTGGVTLDLQASTASGGMAADDTINGFESASGSFTASDKIYGTSGANTIISYGGDDKVYDRGGNDLVKLGDGNDYVLAGGGADTYQGGAGIDYLSYYYSTSGVTLDLQASTASGGMAADDTISSFESASGSNVGNDTIYGTSGVNDIRGYGGSDKLFGRAGNDKLSGGDDADTFYFAKGDDRDVIMDFEDNIDTIALSGFGLASSTEALSYATQSGADVIFNFGSGDILTLENALRSQLGNDIDIL